MNDDKLNDIQNQSPPNQPPSNPINNEVIFDNNKPLYETVTEESIPEDIPIETVPDTENPSQSEILSPQPVVTSPTPKSSEGPAPIPEAPQIQDIPTSGGAPPPIYEEHRNKFLFIGLGGLFFLIIFFLIIRLFVGGGGDKKNAKVTLTYWGLWEDKAVFEPLISEYKRKNPNVDITYIKMSPQDYRAKLLARSKDGKGPDIFRFHNTWLPSIKEVVAPLPDNIISANEYKSTFYPVTETDLKVGKNYYGIPLEIDGLILVYNDELFKKAGIQVAPKTWEDILDSASKLTVKDQSGKIITSGLALGTASNIDHFSDIFGWMLLQNGGDLKNISNAEGQGTLELYRKFAEQPNNIWDADMPNSINAFVQRKVAMIIVPSWQVLVIKQQDPDISLKTSVLPVLPGGTTISLANYWVEGVSRYSKNQIEAWKFLHFLSQKENMTKLYGEMTKIKPYGEPYSRVDLGSLLEQEPNIGPVIQQAKGMKSLPLVSKTYDNGMNDEIIKYLEDAINKTEQGVSYQDALSTAQKGIEQVYTKYKVE